MVKIKICDDFSEAPGGRYIQEGEHSGEEFRDNILLPKFEEAEKNNEMLEIDFDGGFGFGTSFLEEAFGGLVREHHKKNVLKVIKIISTEDEMIPELITKYVKDAEAKLKWKM